MGGGGARRAPTPGAPEGWTMLPHPRRSPRPSLGGLAPGEVGPSASAESAQSREEDVFPARATRALPVSSHNLTLDCLPEAGPGTFDLPARHAGPVVWLMFAGSSRRAVLCGSLRPKLMSGSRPGGVLPGALKLIMTPDRLLKSAATNVNKIKAT